MEGKDESEKKSLAFDNDKLEKPLVLDVAP